MTNTALPMAALVLGLATSATADQVFNDDVIVDGRLCSGQACVNGELFNNSAAKFRSTQPDLQFDDTSPSGEANTDWRIIINDIAPLGIEGFAIKDDSADKIPFTLSANAPDNAIFMAGNGNIGVGTALPQSDIHILGASGTSIRLENTSGGNWELNSSTGGFTLVDRANNAAPIFIENDAPTPSLIIDSTGDIGLGTFTPNGKLHTKGDGVQLAYFESGDGDAVQVRFRTDSENRRFLAVDNDDNVKTQMQFRDNSIKFLGQTVADEWLSVSAAGITTAGPTCNPGPCDATFDPDAFTVPSIEDHAAYMWENQHLWAVGPTAPNQPFNLTQKAGGMLHELEVAHIYIEQLHGEIADLKAAHAARLTRIEAQLQQLQGAD